MTLGISPMLLPTFCIPPAPAPRLAVRRVGSGWLGAASVIREEAVGIAVDIVGIGYEGATGAVSIGMGATEGGAAGAATAGWLLRALRKDPVTVIFSA